MTGVPSGRARIARRSRAMVALMNYRSGRHSLRNRGERLSYPRLAYSPLVTIGKNRRGEAENVRNWLRKVCE